MEPVFQLIDEGAARLAAHPLLDWVREAPVPLEKRMAALLPPLAPFALGYRDICTWVLPYGQPQTALQRALNEHAGEDATHSRLFLENWQALNLDDLLGWRPGDVLWWLFLAPETAPMRQIGMQLLAMPAADGGDPLLRCAWAEAIEAAGAVFFSAVAPLAEKLAGQTGRDYRYLGNYHLSRESGHVQSDDLFRGCRLDELRRVRAKALATSTLEMFGRVFDCSLSFATAYLAAGQTPRRPCDWPAPRLQRPAPTMPGRAVPGRGSNAEVQALLELRLRRTAHHPLYQCLSSPGGGPAADQLAQLLPAWAMDIMGYRDLCLHSLRYPQGEGPGAEVNAWAEQLASHSAVFLADWDALEMDARLGWTASQTLGWLYLDPCTDVHRRNMARFTAMAAASAGSPLCRLWLMTALEASGEGWFAATRRLAERAEQDLGVRLDYLAGRCEGPRPAGGRFRQQRLAPAQAAAVQEMITVVFDAVDEQLDLSMAAAVPRPGRQAGEASCG